jgi:2-polyprenyl-3-methyl-5-hydroxy-6-metoxy-1,4-benzoquinol methylase
MKSIRVVGEISPCVIRARDIESGFDKTYNNIIVPRVLDSISAIVGSNAVDILDIGCGCGFLTDKIGKMHHTHGIDISAECIQYAMQRYNYASFEHCDIYQFRTDKRYDICTAIMVAHMLPDYDTFLKQIVDALNDSGKLIIVIPHPYYWATEKILSFEYAIERKYAYDFKISKSGKYWEIDYYHRTMETYITRALNSGFLLSSFSELFEQKNGKEAQTPHLLELIFTHHTGDN